MESSKKIEIVQLVGYILEVCGAIIIAASVVRLNQVQLTNLGILEFENIVSENFHEKAIHAYIGLGFIITGFILNISAKIIQLSIK